VSKSAVEERQGWQRTCEQGGDQYAIRTAAEDSARNTQGGDRDASEQGNDRYVSTEQNGSRKTRMASAEKCASPAERERYQNFIIFNFRSGNFCSGDRFLTYTKHVTKDFGISSFLDANPKCDMNVSVYVKMAQTI